ncbi:MAG TPA: c-type cytochrome [Terriglobia bacterium]|nr:c-type cytochrome [Terriglobia bacterium]
MVRASHHRCAVFRALATGLMFAGAIVGARRAAGQSPATAGAGRKAEEQYKNIQVLKGIPADQIPATMRLVAASLGVQCSFCHVQGANDKDDKPEKQTARRMMAMVLDMNKGHFNGRTAITCNTCHRGSPAPVGTPAPEDMGRPAQRGSVPEGVTAELLLEKYLQTMGGEEAVSRITSVVAKGTLESAANPPSPLEIYVKFPDKRLVVSHVQGDDSSEATAGAAGWTSSAARGLRDMTAADNEAIKLEDPLYLVANVKKIYTQWRVGRSEKVGDRDAYVLNGTAPGHLPIRLHLDQQTGELLRLTHFTETPLGRLPTQLSFGDYRAVGNVKLPFRIAAIRPTTRNTIQLEQVQVNVPLEDSLFAKPASPAR